MAIIAVAMCGMLAPAAAQAGPDSPQRAVVTLGDSYISGEAGRWKGNSETTTGDSAGTDRAWDGQQADVSKVYIGGSDVNGCHRSDVAEVISATMLGTTAINLACSGAETINVLRSASGGQPYKDPTTQGDQLVDVAKNFNVKVIVLSIGGNDLGFSDLAQDCVLRYFRGAGTCHDDAQKQIDQRMPATMSNVRHVIDDVRAIMKGAGYEDDDYRFILQSYVSPVPRGSENRLPESGWSRVSYGCGMWNDDLDWARDSFVPQMSDNLRAVADAENVGFLDVRNLLQGHEVCSKTAQADGTGPEKSLEWARSVSITQGDRQESLHPNALGQKALGACLRKAIADEDGLAWVCRAGAGVAPTDVTLDEIKRKPIDPLRQRKRPVDVTPGDEGQQPWSLVTPAHIVQAIGRRGGPTQPAG